MNDDVMKQLQDWKACRDAIAWVTTQKSPKAAWQNCKRGDWMLWVLDRLSGPPESEPRRKLVLCACACARLSLKYVPKQEPRPRKAIETAEKWARREANITLVDVRNAAADAYAAAVAYAAADAAAYAAAVAYAADAAYAAADAAAVARMKTLAKCADIVRKHYPTSPNIFAEAK